ncbi:hypothetical protein IMSAGC019_00454 [Lachnospiraceae bacterium]|nr:hypothetical protein IMSAGC019_00454 [Lachnospiraceae bacterium]
MKHGKQLIKKIKIIDIAIIALLLIALSLSGYVHMVKAREMGNMDVFYTKEENQGIKQDGFQMADSD